MANTTNSPNMLLPVPVVGQDPGPTYAQDINNCLTIIDSHNHTAGSGVPITPAGIDINSDLLFNNNNATALRTLRFQVQGSTPVLPADLGCLYEQGVDLYFIDGGGNNIRITQSGGIAGTPGSIANLTSPASASYVSGTQTFVWESDASTAANMDFGSAIFRNLTASSFGVTVQAPNALGSNYTLTLPAVPASQKIMSLDSSGNMAAPYSVDNSTLEISANVIQQKNGGTTQAKLHTRAVTTDGTDPGAGGVCFSASATYSITTAGYTNVPNLSCVLTTLGRPIHVRIIPDGTAAGWIGVNAGSGSGMTAALALLRDGTIIYEYQITNSSGGELRLPASVISSLDIAAAGTYTYTVQIQVLANTGAIGVADCKLLVYED